MAMCRPRGGRAAPRYHHVKDASERRMWRLMHQEQEEPQQQGKTDEMIERLAIYTLAMDSMLANVKQQLNKE